MGISRGKREEGRLAALVLLALPLWMAGCGDAGSGSDGGTSGADEASAAEPVRKAVTPARRPGGPLRVEGGRVWVDLDTADPSSVLWDLSAQAGFVLEVGDLDPEPVSLRFDGAPLDVVVAALAGEQPFAFSYEPTDAGGAHALVSVRVGREPERAEPRRPAPPPRELDRDRERRTPDHERLLRALDIANIEARRELVAELDAEGVELDVLAHVVENDPDPELRSLAADTLASGGTYASVRSLLGLLDSDDPAVLLLALEALEFAGDESVVSELRPLLNHPDAAVRDMAEDVVDFLE